MKRSNESKIDARFNSEQPKRKNITFNLDEELLQRLDAIVTIFYEKDGSTTRNAILEEATSSYVDSAEDYFEEQNLKDDNALESGSDFDTAIFPALNENFKKQFLGDHEWSWIRMAEHRVNNVKYIALFRGAPSSSITHFAEVESISDPDPKHNNKRLIRVKEPVKFSNEIKLGDTPINNVRKLFYTSLKKLKDVNTIAELLTKKN